MNERPFTVDADAHILEPPTLWEEYLEPRYRARAIKIVSLPGQGEQLVVDNEVIMPFGLAGLGGAELDARELFTNPTLTYLDGAPRASMEPEARLKLFDDWQVDAGVIFPTIGILWDKEDDPELAMAYARAYNRWQWDFSSSHLDRFAPIAHVPLYDPALALVELRRCLKLGFKGVFVAPEPVCGKKPSHPDFDPLWAELQESGPAVLPARDRALQPPGEPLQSVVRPRARRIEPRVHVRHGRHVPAHPRDLRSRVRRHVRALPAAQGVRGRVRRKLARVRHGSPRREVRALRQ